LKAFTRGLEFDENDSQLKQWHDRCQKELPVPKQITPEEKATPPAAAAAASLPAPPKPKHSFYQTDSILTIQIPIKSLKKDQVQLQTTDTTLHVETKIPSYGTDYLLDIDLAYPIDSTRTTFNVTNSNIEIKLYKRQSIQWSSLDAKAVVGKTQPPVTMNRPVDDRAPSYPSSSQRAKDWNKLEAEIKKNEKENKDEVADANSIFQQLYRDSDENTRRAMNKSMYESGGTCLNMNWEEVSKGNVTCDPPDGMEWKKYDS